MVLTKLLVEAGIIAVDSIRRNTRHNNPNHIEPSFMDVESAARMAYHVYGTKYDSFLTNGWQESGDSFGITLDDRDYTGLVSKIYERTVNGEREYVYATAGTDPDNVNDWIANFSQLGGFSEQYHLSAHNARILSKAVGHSKLTFVGHSLGGGEAALNAMVTGRPAITFNAVGISSATRLMHGVTNNEANIDAYIVMTDWLNLIQTAKAGAIPWFRGKLTYGIGTLLRGVSFQLSPADGKHHYLTPQNPGSILSGHSMNAVIASLEI